jgi:hypothetical protein
MGKTRLAVLAAVVVAAGALVATATAATSVVSLVSCANNGGTRTVPAGNSVDLRTGWVAANAGLVRQFLAAETTTLSIDDTAVPNVDSYWGPIGTTDAGYAASWFDYVLAPLSGPTTIDFTVSLSHPLIDRLLFDENGAPLRYDGVLLDGSCTIVPV